MKRRTFWAILAAVIVCLGLWCLWGNTALTVTGNHEALRLIGLDDLGFYYRAATGEDAQTDTAQALSFTARNL